MNAIVASLLRVAGFSALAWSSCVLRAQEPVNLPACEWGVGRVAYPRQLLSERSGTAILEDELDIRLRNTKPEFMSLHYQRRMLVRFASGEDIDAHARIVLPESLDPLYDQRFTPWDERGGTPHPCWMNTQLEYFGARVIQPNGSWHPLSVDVTRHYHPYKALYTMERSLSHAVTVHGIEPGDVVEFRWKYAMPYDNTVPGPNRQRGMLGMDNWAWLTGWRIFFHRELPILQQRITMEYKLQHGLALFGTPPTLRTEAGDHVNVVWENKDLPGCLHEVNARPANDLPHVVIAMVADDMRYWKRDRLSGIPVAQSPWLVAARARERRALWLRRVSLKRVPDKQGQLLNAFIQREGGTDADPVRRMERLHEHIAMHFAYQDDRLWFEDIDRRNARMGDQVQEGRIREISRYDLYVRMMGALRLDYSTAYVLDARIGAMNDRYLTPLWDLEHLFLVRGREGPLWMHPKRMTHGWLANEFPFYWAGTSALLTSLDILLEDYPPPPLFLTVPRSSPGSDLRATEVVVDIEPHAGTALATVRMLLSGQYSTLGRARFLGTSMDSTVMPAYGEAFWDRPGVRLLEMRTKGPDLDAPFRFQVEARVDLSGLLVHGPDSTWTFDVGAMLGHVAPEPFDATDRVLPFHWDFQGSDRIKIMLRAPSGIRCVTPASLEGTWSVPSARLERSVRSTAVDPWVVESLLHIVADREEPEQVQQLVGLLSSARPGRTLIGLVPAPTP